MLKFLMQNSKLLLQVLDLQERPRKMAIIGGGYIAVEFAGIYNNFGTEVHLLYRQAWLPA